MQDGNISVVELDKLSVLATHCCFGTALAKRQM